MTADAPGSPLPAPNAVAIGLQEWATVCTALLDGRLLLAVRKGGVHEWQGGLFAPEHPRFALLPTQVHQRADRLRPEFADELATSTPPAGTIPVAGWCGVERVWKATDLGRVQALGDELAWTAAELASRFAYRDQPFLYVLALRAWRLPVVQVIADRPAYAGCRSWIPLQDTIATVGSLAAVSDTGFATRLAHITSILGSP